MNQITKGEVQKRFCSYRLCLANRLCLHINKVWEGWKLVCRPFPGQTASLDPCEREKTSCRQPSLLYIHSYSIPHWAVLSRNTYTWMQIKEATSMPAQHLKKDLPTGQFPPLPFTNLLPDYKKNKILLFYFSLEKKKWRGGVDDSGTGGT